jgi:hypothetical protein
MTFDRPVSTSKASIQPADTDDTAVAALVFAGEDPGVGL